MDISSSPSRDDRTFPPITATTANSSFLVTPVRPSLTSTTSTPISVSASASDTDISTSNSAAVTPLGTSVPTTTTTATFLSLPANRDRSGTVIARNFWDVNGQQDQTVTPVMLHHAQRSTNLSNATIVDRHAGRPSSSHSIQPSTTADNSPAHSTDTSRPETETEDDENVDVDAEGDVDMEDASQLNPISTMTSSVDTEASTSTAIIQSIQMPANVSPSAPHRTRRSVSRRAGASAAAVGIVSNDTPLTVPTHTTQPSHHHIIINEDLGDLGLNSGGVGVGVVGGVGVEDGIVSLDQQANEDFAMGAPPGAPGAIDTTPTFGVGTVGVGRPGTRHHHSHHDRHNERHHRETSQPDVTPRATVIGLPSSVDQSPLSISNSNLSTRAGAHHHTLPSPLTAFGMGARGRSPTAPESVTEPLINVDGHAIGSPSSSFSGNGTGGGSTEGGTSTAMGDVSPSSTVVASSYMPARPSMPITSFPTFVPTTDPIQQSASLVGIQSAASTSSTATAAANNTISNGNFTSGTGTGATNTPSTATASGMTPTSVIASQQFPGPYRGEDVLLGLQLLAYLSKYPHVRQAFYKTRPSFHPATATLVAGSSSNVAVGGTAGGSAKGKGVMGMGICGQSQISPPVQKDRGYFKTFNGSSVMSPTIGGPPMSGASASTSGLKNGKEKALPNPTPLTISASNSSHNNVNSTGPGTPTLSSSSGVRQTNVFSLVERFTFKPSSSELANGSTGVGAMPRLPPEIQYWAGVVMRNACRKDDLRGGVRQCANSRSTCSHLKSSADESLLLFSILPFPFEPYLFSALRSVGNLPSRICKMQKV